MKHAKSLLLFLLSGLLIFSSCRKTTEVSHIITHHDSVSNTDWSIDTAKMEIISTPVSGDNSPMIQAMINYAIANPGYTVAPSAGYYYLYEPLVAAKIVNGAYSQISINIIGASDAKDGNSGYTTNFVCMFTQGFGLGIQLGKGCTVQNIAWTGQYTLPNTLSIAQIDTLPYASWNDGKCGFNATSPYTAIAIDPFSDPAWYDGVTHQMYPGLSQYYLSGMSRSGSTDITIANCRANQFVVGFIVTPSFQQNGDLINFNSDRFDVDRDGIAFTQAQSKMCEVNDGMSWGQVYSVFDGINYGAGFGDGSTFADINGMSIAGNTHQIFNVEAKSFTLNATNVFAESVYKIGVVLGQAGAFFSGFQIDFQVALAGVPSPDFYSYGYFITWNGCMLRVYNNGVAGAYNRIVLNGAANQVVGGMMSSPPICANQEEILRQVQPGNYPITFSGVSMYYTSPYQLNINNYDSLVNLGYTGAGNYMGLGYTVPVTINPGFTGSFICPASKGNGIKVGETIVGYKFYTEQFLTQYDSYEYPFGFVTSVSLGATQDTVYLRNTGYGVVNGNYNLWDAKINQNY